MYNYISYEAKGKIGYLTINRPKALNALNTDVLIELQNCMDHDIAPDDNILVVVVTGAGKAFVAGADIGEMKDATAIEGHAYTSRGHKLMNTIENMPKIFIAAVNGFALGGGLELAMACDIRIASKKAVLGQPETHLGIIPGFGGTQRLPRLVGKGMAKYMILSATNIRADEALRIGLVEKVTEPDELMNTVNELAETIAANAPIALKQAKKAINNGMNADMHTASEFEIEAITTTFATEDKKEGMTAFFEKRPAEFKDR